MEIHLPILISLGLTKNEARVYFNLAKTGSKTAKEIAQITGITRQDIYRIMPSLHGKGLVEKNITFPTRYKAVAIESGITALLRQKKVEYEKLSESSKMIIRDFEKAGANDESHADNNFVLVPQKTLLLQRLKESVNKSRNSVDIVTSAKRLGQGDYEFIKERNKALKRNIKFRFLVNKIESEEFSLESFLTDKTGNLEYRTLLKPPEAILVIIDKREAFLITSAEALLKEAPALWSTNSSFLAIAQNYFDSLWNAAE